MDTNTIYQTVEDIMTLYEMHGNASYGENVTQNEHMLQAALLAQSEGYDEEVVLAAFLHDIGHLCENILDLSRMDQLGVAHHELYGAKFLQEKGFSHKITALISNHVNAKRYLVFKDPAYYQGLSMASRQTLEYQGGKMNAEEAKKFEADPYFELHIKLRNWDDEAKIPGATQHIFADMKALMIKHLEQNINNNAYESEQ